jgi:hypothetical protein
MAEQEVIKHAKAAIAVLGDRKKKWSHKLREVLLEVAIIVFAVSLSIWLHNWSESRKDGDEEKEFLKGLKEDLKADLSEMNGDRDSYLLRLQGTRYFVRMGVGEPYNQDSMEHYLPTFFAYAQINPRISRFEALKGSGKLGIIGNKNLQFLITDLYAKDFPRITRRNDYTNNLHQSLVLPYLTEHLQLDTAGRGTNWPELLRTSRMRLLVFQGASVQDCIDAYDAAIDKCGMIIKEIDRELK